MMPPLLSLNILNAVSPSGCFSSPSFLLFLSVLDPTCITECLKAWSKEYHQSCGTAYKCYWIAKERTFSLKVTLGPRGPLRHIGVSSVLQLRLLHLLLWSIKVLREPEELPTSPWSPSLATVLRSVRPFIVGIWKLPGLLLMQL